MGCVTAVHPLGLFSVWLIRVITQESAVKWIVFCADDESLSKHCPADKIDVFGRWIKFDPVQRLEMQSSGCTLAASHNECASTELSPNIARIKRKICSVNCLEYIFFLSLKSFLISFLLCIWRMVIVSSCLWLYNSSCWLNPVDQKKFCRVRNASGCCDYPIKQGVRKLSGVIRGTRKGSKNLEEKV